MMEQDYPVT